MTSASGGWGLHTNPSICELSCLVLFLSTPLETGRCLLLRSGRTQVPIGQGSQRLIQVPLALCFTLGFAFEASPPVSHTAGMDSCF